jgi:hypothetical protein
VGGFSPTPDGIANAFHQQTSRESIAHSVVRNQRLLKKYQVPVLWLPILILRRGCVRFGELITILVIYRNEII